MPYHTHTKTAHAIVLIMSLTMVYFHILSAVWDKFQRVQSQAGVPVVLHCLLVLRQGSFTGNKMTLVTEQENNSSVLVYHTALSVPDSFNCIRTFQWSFKSVFANVII
jgi:hypothetical protein